MPYKKPRGTRHHPQVYYQRTRGTRNTYQYTTKVTIKYHKLNMQRRQDYYQKHTNLPPNQYNPTPTKTGKGGKEEKENNYTYPPDILNPDHTSYPYYATQ